jgi:hypothetical protein
VEWCLLWPLSISPSNNDVTATEGAGVLCPIVLDNTLEPIEPGVALTVVAMAKEQLSTILFCQRFELIVIYPLHILQYQVWFVVQGVVSL